MTQHTARATLIVIVALAAMLPARDARAQLFEPSGKDTLRALPGVEVLVEPLEPGLARSGIAAATIAADVSAQLRAGGITIYPSQTQNPSPAKAYLYLQVSGFQVPRQGYAIAVQAHVRQSVRSLVTESTIVNAMTWDRSIVFLAPTDRPAATVNREVQDLVEQFVEDWNATR